MTRIISGTARGRRLKTPPGDGTRPTSDRVREALFSAIESQLGSLQGLRFLDLYAGTGAIGLEAMSRGAGVVSAVESDRRVAKIAAANAASLGFHRYDLSTAPVERFLAIPPRAPYDVVFADPPYPLDESGVADFLGALVAGGWLDRDSLVIVERSARSLEPAWPGGLVRERTKEYGETVLWYARADSDDPAPS